jgi:hypothetical protein
LVEVCPHGREQGGLLHSLAHAGYPTVDRHVEKPERKSSQNREDRIDHDADEHHALTRVTVEEVARRHPCQADAQGEDRREKASTRKRELQFVTYGRKHDEGDLRELRKELAKQLGIDEVPNVIWKKLLQKRTAYFAVLGGEDSFNEAVDEAKDWLEVWRGRSSGGRGSDQDFYRYLNDHEREQAEVKAQVLAKCASADARVQAFRDRCLGGEPLTPEQAQAFVASHANQNLPTQWFVEHGVSFLDHTTAIQSITFRDRYEIIEFAVRPAGIKCRVEKDALSEEYGSGRMLAVKGDRSNVVRDRQTHVSWPTPEHVNIAQDGIPHLDYWRGFTGYVRTGSPLGDLRDLGEYLTKRYRGWHFSYATRFVLTGEPPEERPLRTEKGLGDEITIHAAPWISPESVKNAYVQYRHDLSWFRGWMRERHDDRIVSDGNLTPKRRRRPSDKNLKLLSFITERIDHRGRRPQGKEVAAEWDAKYPEWAYKGDTRTMWRDYKRALKAVARTAAN